VAAHIQLVKSHFDLKNWPETLERIPKTPAGRALDAKLVNEADVLRLKAIARLHARGLPPPVDWSDLLQEAFTRVLDGSRQQPEGVLVVAFLAEVMRSIKEQYWRQYRRGARQLPKLLAELGAVDFQVGELADPAPSPERRFIAIEQMEAINGLFEEDPRARQLIAALYEGWTPEETCATYAMSRTDYDSTRKRIRRALIRAGLRFPDL
jgi:RNA polymerase sigma factor (sigma-70 family)